MPIEAEYNMPDLLGDKTTEILTARRLKGKVDAVLSAPGHHFATVATDTADMTLDGISGDHHAGATRKAGGREPWYPRGTVIRNERQVSLVSADELAAIARAMGVATIKPEWLGANIVVSGIADFSMLPPRSLLFFEGGATLKVDGQNAPCKIAGRAVADGLGIAERDETALGFVKAAKRLRGLVAFVEKPGKITAGAALEARVPEHWVYRG
jgi:hypothetical protein